MNMAHFVYTNIPWFVHGAFQDDNSLAGVTAFRFSYHGVQSYGGSRVVVGNFFFSKDEKSPRKEAFIRIRKS